MKEKKLRPPGVSLFKRTALALLGILLLLVLLEAGLRLGGFVLLSVQEHGNVRSIKQKGVYRILCLGESTTQRQYPHLLEQVLNQRKIGVRFSVIDKGRSGIGTQFLLSHVEAYLAEYRPDMVVAMMGINDKRVRYYQDIPESDNWLFRNFRVYRFGRILFMHLLKKIKREDIYGFNETGPGKKARLEDAEAAAEKAAPLNEMPAERVAKSNPPGARGSPGPRSPSLSRSMLFEAEESLKKTAPQNDNAYVGLGKLFQKQGKLSQAEDSFRKAIELNPRNDGAYVELGMLYRNQGKLPQAEDFFQKTIELNPKNDTAYVELGWLYLDQSKFPQAEDSFRKAIGINPKNDYAFQGLGRFYREQKKFSQAEDVFKKAIGINPKNDYAYVKLGWLYQDHGDFSQAEDSLRKAVEINPKNDRGYFELGVLYRGQGKFSQAEDAFRNAIEIDPENDRVIGAMASLYEEMGKPGLTAAYTEKTKRLRSEYFASITGNNYRKLKRILDGKGIKLVCVQYPMRNVTPLKKIFEKDQGVFFVDNERVFKEALKKGSYQEYFTDIFGGDFGHCTQKGNMLLAQNIADVILREIFNK